MAVVGGAAVVTYRRDLYRSVTLSALFLERSLTQGVNSGYVHKQRVSTKNKYMLRGVPRIFGRVGSEICQTS